MATIPLHVWASRVGSLEQPDWCVLDLDPKEAPFEHVVQVARAAHRLCEDIELPSFIKTSGSTGLHVLLPLARQLTYEQCARWRGSWRVWWRRSCRRFDDHASGGQARPARCNIDYVQNGTAAARRTVQRAAAAGRARCRCRSSGAR